MSKNVLLVLILHCIVALAVASLVMADTEVKRTDGHVTQADITQHPACPLCGMDRGTFAHSRISIEYDDGSSMAACSLHCAALDMALNIDKAPRRIGVGDYHTKELIDAEKAVWVIGGRKMGVMTKRAKWAFASQAEAEKFIQAYGGRLVTFEAAMQAAYEDMYQDTKMIRDRRKMRRMKQMSQHN